MQGEETVKLTVIDGCMRCNKITNNDGSWAQVSDTNGGGCQVSPGG